MSDSVPNIREERVGALTTFWVETPPPWMATLAFRVGAWDETVLNLGITHLLEHLALHPLYAEEYDLNGAVAGDCMSFFASGTEEEIVRFVGKIGASLRALPTDRIEAEARVLHAEVAARERGSFENLLATLFGATGPGLLAYPERGFDLVGPAEVQAWADRYTGLRNAVLMLSGPTRPDVKLDLAAGKPRPFRMPEPKGGYRPKRTELIDTQDRGICLGAVVDRSTDLPLAWQVMTQRLTDRLRHELGLVYSVASMYLPLDAATAYAYVGVDALEFQVEEIGREFLGVVRALRDDGPTAAEVARLLRKGLIPVGTDKATIARGELHRVATNRLLGHSEDPWETLAAERQAATPESLRAAFRAATDRAAVVGPGGDVLDLPRRRPTRHHALQGRLFRPKRYPPGGVERLVVAESGLSGRFSGEWFTVRWDEILVADKENPTRWALFHHDGSWLRIDAADFWRRRTLQRALDERIPSEVRLPAERRP